MPRITKSALGDPEHFRGDIRSHVMAIDPYQVEQFVETGEGTFAKSQISLNFACRQCHYEDSATALPKTDEELLQTAIDYHTPPAPEEVVPNLEPEEATTP